MNKKYNIVFNGRLNGSIGITYQFEKQVEAESEASAIMKLYSTHEHLSNIKIEEVK